MEAAGGGWLVLEPHRIELTETELAEPLHWLHAPGKDPDAVVARAQQLFGDDDPMLRR